MRRTPFLLAILLGTACGSSTHPSPIDPPGTEPPDTGKPVSVSVPPARAAETDALRRTLGEGSQLTADTFRERYAMSYGPALNYDPLAAAGMDRINGSKLAPSASEREALAKNGFVICKSHPFPTFSYGYATLYSQHLPLYVSADSILDAVHLSYDRILASLERSSLAPELRTLLEGLRSTLGPATAIGADARRDVDFYLTVALALLTGTGAPVASADRAAVDALVADATAATGTKPISLFGVSRTIDFSQFKPRGHYDNSPDLQRYFRAMMWLGRIDFRLIETLDNGDRVFHRRQFDAMLALHALFNEENIARHRGIDEVIQTFVGESDNLKLSEVTPLLAALGASPTATSVSATDDAIAQAILDGGYGAQRIASDIMVHGTLNPAPLPLHRTFLVFGQRYVIDSEVLSNVVYDRVPNLRMLPNALDVAFAALKNDQAGAMLDGELRNYGYAPNLASVRVLADAHGAEFWEGNLYNLWLSALRALSPSANDVSNPSGGGMPLVTGTEPWQRRMLNTQLGSWAELRHDTILYAKQSYTTGNACEFPDAYVDPYPAFFSAIERFADHGMRHVVTFAERGSGAALAPSLRTYFELLGKTATMLRQMAEFERSGSPLTAEMLAFINQAVDILPVCGSSTATGWYPKLVFGGMNEASKFDPTIADVHTQPFEPGGAEIGRVLHAGTGYPRTMIVTTNGCMGPRAYAGLVFSYHEATTEKYDRLTDQRWSQMVKDNLAIEVPWMSDLQER